MTCSDFTVDSLSADSDYTMIYYYKDDIGGSQTVEFKPYSETKYQYYLDGEAMGKVTVSSLKDVEASLNELLNQ